MVNQQPAWKDRFSVQYNGIPAQLRADGGTATIFEYGALSPAPTIYPLFAALKKGLVIRGYTLFEIVNDSDRLARGKQFVYDGLESGALSPVIDGA